MDVLEKGMDILEKGKWLVCPLRSSSPPPNDMEMESEQQEATNATAMATPGDTIRAACRTSNGFIILRAPPFPLKKTPMASKPWPQPPYKSHHKLRQFRAWNQKPGGFW